MDFKIFLERIAILLDAFDLGKIVADGNIVLSLLNRKEERAVIFIPEEAKRSRKLKRIL